MRLLSGLLCRTALLLAVACCVYGAVVIGFKVPTIGWCILGVVMWMRYRIFRRRGASTAHGSARVANVIDLYANGLLGGEDGLILGRASYTAGPTLGEAFRYLITLPPWRSDTAVALVFAAFSGRRWGRDGIIRVRNYVHLLTCSKTGGGKGVSVLVPNLLSYTGSCVVTDPKGELFRITGEHRRRKFKHQVIRIDPFGLGGPGSAKFNPMDLIDPNSPDVLDQCRDLASMLVVRTGKEPEPHWNDMAELVLTTFIAFVAVCDPTPACRNLQTVRDFVSDREEFTKALEFMKQSNACGGMLRRLAASLSWLVEKELGSVLASVQRHTNFLDSSVIDANTASSSFDPRELRTRRMTVYLCLPPDKLVSLSPLQRMWIGSILRAVTMGGASEHNRVLFLLDEVGNMKHIQALEDAVTLLRGYGVRLWFIFQSIQQIHVCFGDRAPIFLDNIDTQQYFGISSYPSAETISKMLGDATITNESYNRTRGDSRSYGKGQEGVNVSTGSSVTISELGRAIARPDEITRCPEDMAWIFHGALPPIRAQLLKYYNAPEFKRGGTGRSRRRGFAALVWSLCLLALSVTFAAFAIDMPAPVASLARGRRVTPYPGQQQPYGPYQFYSAPPPPSVSRGMGMSRPIRPQQSYRPGQSFGESPKSSASWGLGARSPSR
jgi:type IV secretion system protein VirD4